DVRQNDVLERWRQIWPQALDVWSTYTLLREPRFFDSNAEASSDGMAGQLAAIRLRDQVVMVNVAEVCSLGLEDDALAILAHEVGHHVYVPGQSDGQCAHDRHHVAPAARPTFADRARGGEFVRRSHDQRPLA